MTPARPASYGLGTPPPLQLWLHAVLMLFAELVSHAVSTLQMVLVRRTRECHTKASHDDLPRETSGNPFKETHQAAPTGLSQGSGLLAAFPAKAGIQTPREARTNNSSALRALTSPPPSRGTRVDRCAPRSLLSFRAKAQRAADPEPGSHTRTLSPLMPTNVGIQGRRQILSKLAASIRHTRQNRSWIPTFVGMSGYCRGLVQASA